MLRVKPKVVLQLGHNFVLKEAKLSFFHGCLPADCHMD